MRTIQPRMYWRRWYKLHSRSPPLEVSPLRSGEVRNYDTLPPQVNEKSIANNPPPMVRRLPPKPTGE